MSHDYTAPSGEFSVIENPDGSISLIMPSGVETVPGVTIRDHPLIVRVAVVAAIARKITKDHQEHS